MAVLALLLWLVIEREPQNTAFSLDDLQPLERHEAFDGGQDTGLALNRTWLL